MGARTRPARRIATRAPRLKVSRASNLPAKRNRAMGPVAKGALIAGGMGALGAVAAGAVVMRREIADAAANAAAEAVAAGRCVGALGEGFIDSIEPHWTEGLNRIRRLGARPQPLFQRLIQPVGTVLVLAAAAVTALLRLGPELTEGAATEVHHAKARPIRRRVKGTNHSGAHGSAR